VVRRAYLEVLVIFFVHKILSQRSITAQGRMQMIASGDLHKCNCEKRVVIQYILARNQSTDNY